MSAAVAIERGTMKKATHSGHCQCCGGLQKLPRGVLSLHGYTVDYGFFSGVCRGARQLPYELSCELIQSFIEEARSALATVRASQAKLREPATEPKGWINEYVPSQGRFPGRHQWKLKDITMRIVPYRDGTGERVEFIYTGWRLSQPDATCEALEYEHELKRKRDVLAVCTELNRRYAATLDREIGNLVHYIKWQQQRVTDWKLAELLPVMAKDDKQGFTPKKA